MAVKKEKALPAGRQAIGEIVHFFDKIKVAVVRANSPIKIGDKIRIVGGEGTDFEQEVKSMQIEHEEVKTAKKGAEFGMKVSEKVREGYKVFKA